MSTDLQIMAKNETSSDPYPYLAKSTQGTLYGPAEFLSESQNKFRFMNPQEMKAYRDKVAETRGFDVDGCTGRLPGGIFPLNPQSREWELARVIAGWSAAKHGEETGKPLGLRRLLKANVQGVSGMMYYLTLRAKDVQAGRVKTYRAKVWSKPVRGLEIELFRELTDTENAEMRKKSVAGRKKSKKKADAFRMTLRSSAKASGRVLRSSSLKGKKRVAPEAKACSRAHGSSSSKGSIISDGNIDNVEADMGTGSESKRGRLLANGFLNFLEDVRIQNPSWTYARARRAASRKWRSLSYPEKSPFVTKAENRLKERLCSEDGGTSEPAT